MKQGQTAATPGNGISNARIWAAALLVLLGGLALTVLLYVLDKPLFEDSVFSRGNAMVHCLAGLWDCSYTDSWGPMLDALKLLHDPRIDLYQTLFFDQKVKFQYPTASLLPLLPFASLPQAVAFRIFALIDVVVAMASIFTAALVAGWNPRSPQQKWVLFLIPAVGLFHPLLSGVLIGQIQVWIDFLVLAAVLAWQRNRPVASGVLIGLCCLMKPQLCVLLLWGVLRGNMSFVLAMTVTGLVGQITAGLMFGWQNLIGYIAVLKFLGAHGESYSANNSLLGIMLRAAGVGNNLEWDGNGFPPVVPALSTISTLFSALMVGGFLLHAFRRRAQRADAMELALGFVIAAIASPIAWWHHFGLALPLFVLMARELNARPLPPAVPWLLAASWFLVGSDLQYLNWFHDTPLNVLQAPLFWGTMLLLVAWWLTVRRQPSLAA